MNKFKKLRPIDQLVKQPWSAPVRTEQIEKLLSDEISADELEKMRKAEEKRMRKRMKNLDNMANQLFD